jgi:hypothetical protein
MNHESIADVLLSFPGSTVRSWFGTQGYSVGGNMFAAWSHGSIVLRLPAPLAERTRNEPGTRPWSPRPWSRPMPGWVQFDEPNANFVSLAARAHAHAFQGTPEIPPSRTERAAAAQATRRMGARIPSIPNPSSQD